MAVTGAAGKIGRALAEHLRARGYPLTLIDLPGCGLAAGGAGENGVEAAAGGAGESGVEAPAGRAGQNGVEAAEETVLQADLSERPRPELFAGVEVIVHLAGDPNEHAEWESLLPANIIASYNVAAAAMRAGCGRLIVASSVHAVMAAAGRPVRPEDAVAPADLYGVSKCFVEALAFWCAHSSPMSAAAVRIGAYQTVEDSRAAGAGWMADLFIATSDLIALLERAITAEYRFALLHASAPGPGVLLDTTSTEDLLGWRAEHRFGGRRDSSR